MRDFLRRWAGPGATLLIGVGFEVITPIESTPLAYVAWVVAALWAVYALLPTLKRWRPFTLAPAQTEHRQIEGAAPETTPHHPQTIQAGSIGSIGSVAGDVHINIAPSSEGGEPPDEYETYDDDFLSYETREHFEDEAVHLPVFPLVLDGGIYVRGRTFTNCRIYGPALIAASKPSTYESTFLGNCTFYGDADAMLWAASEDRSGYIGVIAFEGCVFDGCDFYRVGLLMPEQIRSIWLEHWQEQQREIEEGSDETPEQETSDEETTNQ